MGVGLLVRRRSIRAHHREAASPLAVALDAATLRYEARLWLEKGLADPPADEADRGRSIVEDVICLAEGEIIRRSGGEGWRGRRSALG